MEESLIVGAIKGLIASGPVAAVLIWVVLDQRTTIRDLRGEVRDVNAKMFDFLRGVATGGVKGDLDGDGKPG
jgi:hypothetical protein